MVSLSNENKLLKQKIDRKGYNHINLSKNNNSKSFQVHRLVALHFIDNPNNKPQVDHIDNNPSNNCVNNLRWCTQSENNMNYQVSKSNTSCVKGVRWDTVNKKWRAEIQFNGKKFILVDTMIWKKHM